MTSAVAGSPARASLGQQLDLVHVLVERELLLRYHGTALGWLWSLASPLALAAVLHVAFVQVFQLAIEHYELFILAALFPWQCLNNSMHSAPSLFFAHGALVKKSRASRACLCAAVVLGDMVQLLAALPVFGLLALARGGSGVNALWLLGIPVLLLLQAALTLGAVLVLSVANVFVRDLEQLVRVAMLLLFYATPVLFSAELMPAHLHGLLWLNPLAPLMISWRELLLHGVLSPYIGLAALHALLLLGLGCAFFRRHNPSLPELL